MLVRDAQGYWYELDQEVLKRNRIDTEKAREAIAAERAEKTRRIDELLARLDTEEIEMISDKLIEIIPEPRFPMDCQPGHAACDCTGTWGRYGTMRRYR